MLLPAAARVWSPTRSRVAATLACVCNQRVVGEPVNLASRVEALTKDVVATILVSSDIAARLGADFALGRTALLPVKGKKEPVHVVEVLAGAQHPLTSAQATAQSDCP